MAIKKELNKETEYYVQGLSLAVSLDKEAKVVWREHRMVVSTNVATLHIPCTFTASRGVLAADLINALKGCNAQQFTITEQNNTLVISWGRRKAELQTIEQASIYVREPDQYQGVNDIPLEFTDVLRDALKDLVAKDETYATVIQFKDDALYWTNRSSVAQIKVPTMLPHVLLYLKDLQKVVGQKGLNVQHIWWSVRGTISFWYDNGFVIQLPTVDESAIGLPKLDHFFQIGIHDAIYELTEDHFDAVEYVGRFADKIIFIEPTFIGTEKNPAHGTHVETEGLPISIAISADIAKLGAFKKAKRLVKKEASSNVGFMIERENVMFCFSKMKEQ